MRIGLGLDTGGPLEAVVSRAESLAAHGVASLWSSQIFGWDTLTVLAVAGRAAPDVELGTAVVPVQPRHPVALAAQALTVQAATGGRLTLGVGLSHQMVIEQVFGLEWDRPVAYMAEYLEVLVPLLAGEQVGFAGERVRSSTFGPLETEGATPPPVLLAALGPAMLRLAGRATAGTVTWMTGPRTVADHVVPTLTAAAEAAGRPAPRVVVHLPVCVTDDPDGAKERAGRLFAVYGHLPSYRAMLDREGAAGPADVAVVGDEDQVARALVALGDTGATDVCLAPFGGTEERRRTAELAGSLAREWPTG